MPPFTPPAPLGVGLTYGPGLQDTIEACRGLIDFVELCPDVLCRERVDGDERALAYHPELLDDALRWTDGYPLVAHGLGLSIGSVCGWNEGYLAILDQLHAR